MASLLAGAPYACFSPILGCACPPGVFPQVRAVHEKLLAPGGAEELLKDKSVLFFFSGDVR